MRQNVPLWVFYLHHAMQYLDYSIVSPISSWLTWKRIALYDAYYTCTKCAKRADEAAKHPVPVR